MRFKIKTKEYPPEALALLGKTFRTKDESPTRFKYMIYDPNTNEIAWKFIGDEDDDLQYDDLMKEWTSVQAGEYIEEV